jgi:multiple sugar transport system substrate-binding protein
MPSTPPASSPRSRRLPPFVAGHLCSGAAIPASALYQEAGVIMIAPTATNPQPAQGEIVSKVQAALAAGQPPDFLFGASAGRGAARWAYEDQLAELGTHLAPVLDLFDADAIEVSTLLNGKTGQRGLDALPMGRHSNNIHVWNSLLERAGFTFADIPKDWDGFWAFWCGQVQPAVRAALGRDDVWGVGLPMSAAARI